MRLAGLRQWLGNNGRNIVEAGLLPTFARRAGPREIGIRDVGVRDAVVRDAGPVTEVTAAARPVWTPQRLEIVESLWGEGCHLPGIAEEALRMATPFGLSAASSVLLVGAGNGGSALRLIDDLGAWVSACESDPELLAAAGRLIKRAGPTLAKRATLQRWDPAKPSFRRASFHHAVALDAFRAASPDIRPDPVVAAIAQAMRPNGQLAVLETVAAPSGSEAVLRAWCRLERREPPLPGTAWLTDSLERLGFEIRVSEDITARHVQQAVAGWKRFVRELHAQRPTPAQAAALVAEAELWLRRVALLRAGHLQVMRWHATAPAVTMAAA